MSTPHTTHRFRKNGSLSCDDADVDDDVDDDDDDDDSDIADVDDVDGDESHLGSSEESPLKLLFTSAMAISTGDCGGERDTRGASMPYSLKAGFVKLLEGEEGDENEQEEDAKLVE
jgi:hypothetical protein